MHIGWSWPFGSVFSTDEIAKKKSFHESAIEVRLLLSREDPTCSQPRRRNFVAVVGMVGAGKGRPELPIMCKRLHPTFRTLTESIRTANKSSL
jgi:hypothetical protein